MCACAFWLCKNVCMCRREFVCVRGGGWLEVVDSCVGWSIAIHMVKQKVCFWMDEALVELSCCIFPLPNVCQNPTVRGIPPKQSILKLKLKKSHLNPIFYAYKIKASKNFQEFYCNQQWQVCQNRTEAVLIKHVSICFRPPKKKKHW